MCAWGGGQKGARRETLDCQQRQSDVAEVAAEQSGQVEKFAQIDPQAWHNGNTGSSLAPILRLARENNVCVTLLQDRAGPFGAHLEGAAANLLTALWPILADFHFWQAADELRTKTSPPTRLAANSKY